MIQRLPQTLIWDLAKTKWASILNPFITTPYFNGSMITANLASGANSINHLLGRVQQGWVITDQNAAANIYRSAPFNNLTLTLTSSAPVTINLWVF